MAVKSWAVGDVLAANDMNIWTVPIVVTKPGDTSKVNSTIADDPDLQIPVAANALYDVRGVIFYDGAATGTGDIKWTFTFPASSTGGYSMMHQNISGATAGNFWVAWADGPGTNTTQANTNGQGAGQGFTLTLAGILNTAGASGLLTFRWAQQTTNAGTATRVRVPSYLMAQRIG